MKQNISLSYSYATRFTVVFCTVAALIVPVGYFAISYKYLKGIMVTEAEINAELVSRLISANPELWRYETIRIEELLERRPRSGATETRRLLDSRNVQVAESAYPLQSPQLTVRNDVSDNGEVVGTLEISRSMMPILLKSSFLAVLGMGFGLFLYRRLPFRAAIKASKQLQEANDFLKKIMEGSSNALIVLDQDGKIQTFNGRFETLCGISRDELAGSSFDSLFSGDELSSMTAAIHNVMTTEESSITIETVLMRKDGREQNLSCGVVQLLRDDEISGVVVSLDDITERITAEKERLELERQLQQTQKLECLGVLAGGIAHDFNNILTIILGYCYVFKEDSTLDAAHAEHVQRIEDAANRAADLCRQMLSYAGKSDLQHVPINMNMLVTEMVQMLHSGIKRNVTIALDLQEAQVIIADNSQIQQVVMNLIINAAEAIGDKNGAIRVSVNKIDITTDSCQTDFSGSLIPVGRYVRLEVTDNGCGMDKETIDRIFEPFYTTKFTGRGLGMSSTLGIIKSHDGALQFSSAPGEGTTFQVYLPVPGVTVDLDQHPTPPRACHTAERGTILLVDDEEELRVLGPIRLSKLGFVTTTAANGTEALEMYRTHDGTFDLILLDLLMPEMDGIETYRRFREISATVPIVFCSGCSEDDVLEEIVRDTHAGYLKKPYKPDQLQVVLNEMLGDTRSAD
jgi:PAS domain S-box-containing protein